MRGEARIALGGFERGGKWEMACGHLADERIG
jgi:hypothetical protein